MDDMIAIGATAPDFELPSHTGRSVRLAQFRRSRNVVLAFHPLAFTPVCAAQMQTYERERPRLDALETHVLVISVDAVPAKSAWADALGGITYDLLSDFHPKGAVAAAYGVMRDDGISDRAVVVVDKNGIVVWSRRYEIPEQPEIHDLVHVLEALALGSFPQDGSGRPRLPGA